MADERLDLPIPVDLAPERSQNQMLTPVGLDVTPIELGVTPVQLDVAPVRLDVQPKLAGDEVAPHDLPARRGERGPSGGVAQPAPRTPSGPAAASPAADASRGASKAGPKAAGSEVPARKPVSRGLLIAVGGLLVVGLAGAGLLYSGILDPEEPEPAALRGAGGKKPTPAGEGDPKPPDTKVPPGGTLAERAPAVLAKLAAHTPAAYLEAMAAARAAGDEVGVAEAALLLALHYGPSPAHAAEAATALSPHAAEKATFVTRVVGLAALVAGDRAAAEAALGGDDPRSRLYRGWLRLAQGRLDEAEPLLLEDFRALLARVAPLGVAYRHDDLPRRRDIPPGEPRNGHAHCRALAAEWGLTWQIVTTGELDDPRYAANAGDRCYWCKTALLDAMVPLADAAEAVVTLGVNVDDLGDHRPGQQAAAERGARFPLVDAGFTKAMVRDLSRHLGLRTADKPAAACLASRVPYGTPVTVGVLAEVEAAEAALHALGFAELRVRHYRDLARLEVPVDRLADVVERRSEVVDAVRSAGYRYVTLDLEGLRSGNLNSALGGGSTTP